MRRSASRSLSYFGMAMLMALAGCTGESGSGNKDRVPRAQAGRLALVAGDGLKALDRFGPLPDKPLSLPTDMEFDKDGSIIVLANGDIGVLMRISKDGQIKPYSYYLGGKAAGSSEIRFDASKSPQKGWTGMRPASSMVRTNDGSLWIYAERWIAEITSNGRAHILGRLELPERKDGDYATRLFSGPSGRILLIRDGKLYEVSKELRVRKVDLPREIEHIASAASQGNDLLIGTSKSTIYRIRDNNIVAKTKLGTTKIDLNSQIIGIVADDKGQIFASTTAGRLFRIIAASHSTSIAGQGHPTTKSWADNTYCPRAGVRRMATDPRSAAFGYPASLLIERDQLYIADAACSRLYAIGITG